MKTDGKLSIYFVERAITRDTSIQHACLYLMDESDDRLKVVQQIHFNRRFDVGYEMLPNVRKRMSVSFNKNRLDVQDYKPVYDEFTLFPIVGGEEALIMTAWNTMLQNALHMKEKNVSFYLDEESGEYDNNCRSGARALLESIGIELPDGFTMSSNGMRSNLMPIAHWFSFESSLVKDLDEAYSENQNLLDALRPPWAC